MEFETQLKNFSKKIETLSNELKTMKQFGINEDLLIAYLCHHLKIPEKRAREIIDCYEEFYGNFIKKEVANNLTKK